MDEVPDIRQREVEAFFSFVSGADTRRAIEARSYHVLGEFDASDFDAVSETFLDADATASIAFLGRDADRQGDIVAGVDDAGHEVAIHGHRHVSFGDLPYDTAHDDLSTGMDAIEDASGVTPSGFFAPFKGVSEGTLRAADELGLAWVLGDPDGAPVPDGLTLVDSVYPHDTRLLEGGTSPADTFAQLDDAAEDGATFLFHPNLLEYYGATEEFEAWVADNRPTSVGEQVGAGGVAVVLDCLRPLLVE